MGGDSLRQPSRGRSTTDTSLKEGGNGDMRDVEDAVPYKGRGTEHLICHPPYGDLIRRFAPPSPCAGKACGKDKTLPGGGAGKII